MLAPKQRPLCFLASLFLEIMKPDKKFVLVLMFFCAFLVSTSFSIGEHITNNLSSALLTLLRFLIACLLLLPVIWQKYGLSITLNAFFRYGMISGALVTFFYCMFVALKYTTAFNTSVLFTLVPLLAGLYAAVLTGERLAKVQLTGLVSAFIGALLVIFKGNPLLIFEMSWNRGDIIFLLGCLAMGLYTPLVKMLHRGEPMEQMTFWVLVTGSLWLLPMAGFELKSLQLAQVGLSTWGWIFYLALFTTVISFYLTQFSIPFIGPTRVMAYSYLYPPLVLLIDFISGKGLPEVSVVPGILVIMVAMVILLQSARQEERA